MLNYGVVTALTRVSRQTTSQLVRVGACSPVELLYIVVSLVTLVGAAVGTSTVGFCFAPPPFRGRTLKRLDSGKRKDIIERGTMTVRTTGKTFQT